jgi:hypothetical protein
MNAPPWPKPASLADELCPEVAFSCAYTFALQTII